MRSTTYVAKNASRFLYSSLPITGKVLYILATSYTLYRNSSTPAKLEPYCHPI